MHIVNVQNVHLRNCMYTCAFVDMCICAYVDMSNCKLDNISNCTSMDVISKDGWVLSKSLPNFPSNQRETILQKKQGKSN